MFLVGALFVSACGSSTVDLIGSIEVAAPCDDLGGFSDVLALQPIVRDGDGDFVAVFEPLPLFDIPTATPNVCRVTFVADGVPDIGDGVWVMDAGRRGEFVIRPEDLSPASGDLVRAFELTLG